MITTCHKCGDGAEAKLNIDSDEIQCTNCGETLILSSFMKTSLKASGDIIRDSKPTIPLGGMLVTCQKCSKDFSAELNKKTLKCFCPKCKTEFKMNNLSKERLVEYKIFVGETEERLKENEIKEDSQEFDPNPTKTTIPAAKLEDYDIKNIYKVKNLKIKSKNGEKSKALKLKSLNGKNPTSITRKQVDSNGDPIGGQVIFHPEDEINDAELVADLEKPSKKQILKDKTTSKKVKNK